MAGREGKRKVPQKKKEEKKQTSTHSFSSRGIRDQSRMDFPCPSESRARLRDSRGAFGSAREASGEASWGGPRVGQEEHFSILVHKMEVIIRTHLLGLQCK